MPRVLVTGGCGYIGSHTLVELIEDGIDAVSLDNNVRSDPSSMDGVRAITGHDVANWHADLRDEVATDATFAAIGGIDAVIHFAAFKSVGESVREPLVLLRQQRPFARQHSSLGREAWRQARRVLVLVLGVRERRRAAGDRGDRARPSGIAIRAYQADRREDPAGPGAGQPDELRLAAVFQPGRRARLGTAWRGPVGGPENLVPVITQTAIGKRDQLVVFGDDYDTRDGTCVRDYIHVSDVGRAHVDAVRYLLEGRNAHNGRCSISAPAWASRCSRQLPRSSGRPECG